MKDNVFRQLKSTKQTIVTDHDFKQRNGTLDMVDILRYQVLLMLLSFIKGSGFCKTRSAKDFIDTIGMTDSAAAEKLGLSKNTIRAKRFQFGARLKSMFGETFLTDLLYGGKEELELLYRRILYFTYYSTGNFILPVLQDLTGKVNTDKTFELSQCSTAIYILALCDKHFSETILSILSDSNKEKLASLVNTINCGNKEDRERICLAMLKAQDIISGRFVLN